jgi:hypothetical protein
MPADCSGNHIVRSCADRREEADAVGYLPGYVLYKLQDRESR